MALFGDDIESQWPTTLRNALVASLLRHYTTFITIIEGHPEGMYETNARHPFIHSVKKAMSLAKVSPEIFSHWCDEVRTGYEYANYCHLPIHVLSPELARERKVDPRSLFEKYNNLCSSFNKLHMQKMVLEDDVARLRLDVGSLTRSNARLEKTVADQNEILSRVLSILEVKYDKQSNKNEASAIPLVPMVGVKLFSDSVKTWRSDLSVEQIFVKYFTDRCQEGWEVEKNSNEFKAKLPSERNRIISKYKRLKKAIKIMLFFCDNFPSPQPEDPSVLVAWHRGLAQTADQAMKALKEALGPYCPKIITPTFLGTSAVIKDWDNPESPNAKSFPKNTPGNILAHFGMSS